MYLYIYYNVYMNETFIHHESHYSHAHITLFVYINILVFIMTNPGLIFIIVASMYLKVKFKPIWHQVVTTSIHYHGITYIHTYVHVRYGPCRTMACSTIFLHSSLHRALLFQFVILISLKSLSTSSHRISSLLLPVSFWFRSLLILVVCSSHLSLSTFTAPTMPISS